MRLWLADATLDNSRCSPSASILKTLHSDPDESLRLQEGMHTAKTVPWPTRAPSGLQKNQAQRIQVGRYHIVRWPAAPAQDGQCSREVLTLGNFKAIVAICSTACENVYRQGPWMIAKVEVRRFEIAAQSRSDRLAGDVLSRHISTSHDTVRRCIGKGTASRPSICVNIQHKHHLDCLYGQEFDG